MAIRVGIVGASGYSGSVLAALLASHPEVEVVFATSDKRSGEPVAEALHPTGSALRGLRFVPNASALELAAQVEAVFLATSAEVSVELAPKILEATSARVIDLSGAFRLRDLVEYTKYYRFEHPRADLLPGAHYGIPELFGAPPAGTRLVANPGCYATAALLGTAPLLAAGLVEPGHVLIDAKSGVTGAGRQAKEDYSFCEVAGDLRAYKVLAHQHTPEIALGLERFGKRGTVTFVPHLLPIRRGILTTSYLRPKPGVTREQLHACLRDTYANAPFVRVTEPGRVGIKGVAGTNLTYLGVESNGEVAVVLAAIDNLVKGAAGQAVQNLNLAFGLPETAGLESLVRFAP
jgi:N-acetyl-gamma-glutamyl-phosphate reductase